MTELIERAGAIASAVAAVLALGAGLLVKPWRSYKRRKAERDKAEADFRAAVLDKLDALTDDVGDLQYERLSQAHDFYTGRGWCPTSKKDQLCVMYKSYTAKGRNHLSVHYEKEILGLPDKPEDVSRKDE